MLRLVYRGSLPGLNEIINAGRANRFKAASQKKAEQEKIRLQWSKARGIHFDGHVNINVKFFEKDSRRDDDNVFAGLKFLLDAMQEIGIIVKDSPKYCHVTCERFTDRENPHISLTIKEGPPPECWELLPENGNVFFKNEKGGGG